jgi:required for meiotic nuclear division protein 1
MLDITPATLIPAESPVTDSPNLPALGDKTAMHAILVGDRIDTTALERDEKLPSVSALPLAVRAGANGLAVVFRYGVVVFVGLASAEESEFLKNLRGRITAPLRARDREEETASVEVSVEREDQIPPGGPIYVRDMAIERLLLIAYALADSVVLARDEREVASVFETVEPFAQKLAERGRTPGGRTTILKLIGNALLVQHRVSGRVAVAEDPDVLWDRPELGRLYSRLKDEYELKERVDGLSRKLAVIGETAQALTDMIDTQRSLRLEIMIVALIAFEIAITFYQMYASAGH